MPLNANKNKPLPVRTIRFSKSMVAVAILMIASGGIMIVGLKDTGRLVGVMCASLGLAVLFTSCYYWGCDNEACS